MSFQGLLLLLTIMTIIGQGIPQIIGMLGLASGVANSRGVARSGDRHQGQRLLRGTMAGGVGARAAERARKALQKLERSR